MGWEISKEFSQDRLGTEHILYAILQQNKSRTSEILRDLDINTSQLSDKLEDMLASDEQELDLGYNTNVRQQNSRTMAVLNKFGEFDG